MADGRDGVWRPGRLNGMRAIVCLLLGASTTVGIAWLLALDGRAFIDEADWKTIRHRESYGLHMRISTEFGMGEAVIDFDPAWLKIDAFRPDSATPRWLGPLHPTDAFREDVRGSGLGHERHRVAAYGLPFRSLMVKRWTRYASPTRTVLARGHDGLATNVQRRAPRRGMLILPLRPIWPGFAANTLVFAALAWGAWYGLPALGRAVRRQQGRCPSCGYPIGVSAVCTECGEPLDGKVPS